MWVEVCVPIQFTGIMPPTCNTSDNAQNERTKRTNNWCGWWDCCASWFIFYSIHASSPCAERNYGSGGVCQWKYLSHALVRKTLSCTSNTCGVCRCLVYRRLNSTRLDSFIDDVHNYPLVRLLIKHSPLVRLLIKRSPLVCLLIKCWLITYFTWTPSFGHRPVASGICEFVRFLLTRYLTFMWESISLALNRMLRVVSFLFFFVFFSPWKNFKKWKNNKFDEIFPTIFIFFSFRKIGRVHPFLWKLGPILS